METPRARTLAVEKIQSQKNAIANDFQIILSKQTKALGIYIWSSDSSIQGDFTF